VLGVDRPAEDVVAVRLARPDGGRRRASMAFLGELAGHGDRHQARARRAHYARRLTLELQP
jgi:hypothetical protein